MNTAELTNQLVDLQNNVHDLRLMAIYCLSFAGSAVAGLIVSLVMNLRNSYLIREMRSAQINFHTTANALLQNQERFKTGLESAEKLLNEIKGYQKEARGILDRLKSYSRLREMRMQNQNAANPRNNIKIGGLERPRQEEELQRRFDLRLKKMEELLEKFINPI